MVLWRHIFFHFGTDDFPFKIPFRKCFKIFVFPLWRRDPVLKLQFMLSLCARRLLCVKSFFVHKLAVCKGFPCV